MTRPNRFDDEEGVVIHSRAYVRSHLLGIKVKCYIVLRRSASPPHNLEKYDNCKSPNANQIVLKNVIVNSSGKQGFDILLNGEIKHHFYVDSENLASDWIRKLQSFTVFEPLNSQLLGADSRGFPASLFPTTLLNFHGRCRVLVLETSVSINAENGQLIVSWPLKFIRSYGIDKNKFTLKTGRATVTGRAEFVFEVLKPSTPYHIYQELSARISPVAQPTLDEPAVSSPSEETEGNEIGNVHHSYESLAGVTSASSEGSGSCSVEQREEGANENVIYARLPQLQGLTCQLPSKSFQSIIGLEDCVSQLETYLGTRSRLKSSCLLLYGATHAGKRTLANAVATEFQTRLITLHCQTLSSSVHGVDALEKLRQTFDSVLSLKRCVFLLKGIDLIPDKFQDVAVGLEVLEMVHGFLDRSASNSKLVVLFSTAVPQTINDSLLKRLDQRIYVPFPSESGRLQVAQENLKLLSSGDGNMFIKTVAEKTSGFSVNEIVDLCAFLQQAAASGPIDFRLLESRLVTRLSDSVSSNGCVTDVRSSAEFYTKQSNTQGMFFVTLEDNTALPNVRSCFLNVTPSSLELRDLDPSHTIISWTRRTIRGFGAAANLFTLETGRSSSTGEGLFRFQTNEGGVIQNLIQMRCARRTVQTATAFQSLDYEHVV